MKIAILTDVHGNLPALQVALRAIRREGVDAIFHYGRCHRDRPISGRMLGTADEHVWRESDLR